MKFLTHEDLESSMARFENKAKKLTNSALVNISAASVSLGFGTYLAAEGESTFTAINVVAGIGNLAMGAYNLAKSNHESQQAAALRGALASYDLAADNSNMLIQAEK